MNLIHLGNANTADFIENNMVYVTLIALVLGIIIGGLITYAFAVTWDKAIGVEARKKALRESIVLIENRAMEIAETAPKFKFNPIVSMKCLTLARARDDIQYLLDKTR